MKNENEIKDLIKKTLLLFLAIMYGILFVAHFEAGNIIWSIVDLIGAYGCSFIVSEILSLLTQPEDNKNK